jgi:hypothetical protein
MSGSNPGGGIFNHDAVGGRYAPFFGGVEKEIGGRLAVRHITGGKEMRLKEAK